MKWLIGPAAAVAIALAVGACTVSLDARIDPEPVVPGEGLPGEPAASLFKLSVVPPEWLRALLP